MGVAGAASPPHGGRATLSHSLARLLGGHLPTYLALMEDRFTLEANGDFVLNGLQYVTRPNSTD